MRSLLVLLACVFSLSAEAVTGGSVPASDDWRYDAVGAFAVSWRLGFDQGSHADDADHAWFCAATLVNEQAVVFARHCLDAYGTGSEATYMVRFRRAENGSLGTIAGGVSSFYHARISSLWVATGTYVDVAIGFLEEPIWHITPIPMAEGGITLSQGITQAGWGKEGPGLNNGNATQLRLCANTVTGIISTQDQFTTPVPYYSPASSCGPNTWDSGGPTLAHDACGNPTLLAVQATPETGTWITAAALDQAPPDVFYRCPL